MNLRFDCWSPPGWEGIVLRRAVVVAHEQDWTNPFARYLCPVLSEYSLDGCVNVLTAIERVEQGETESTNGGSDSWSVTIYKERVDVEFLVAGGHSDWPVWSCPLDVFKAALEGWKRFLEMPLTLSSSFKVALP